MTDVAGLHSGVNPVSGTFSVGASGRLIEGGALGRPVREITIAGDLVSMLEAVLGVGSEARWVPFGGSVKAGSGADRRDGRRGRITPAKAPNLRTIPLYERARPCSRPLTLLRCARFTVPPARRRHDEGRVRRSGCEPQLTFKGDAGEAVDAVLDMIQEVLQRGGDINFTGFGKFSVAERGARQGVNPQTGERIQIAASNVPRFSAGSALKNAVKGG